MTLVPLGGDDVARWRAFFGGCALVNYALLTLWFVVFRYARDWLRRLHGSWFTLDDATFDAIHYGGMGLYKIAVLVFNLVPWLVLGWMSGNP